jgi:S-adenosylmethionine hydrolase
MSLAGRITLLSDFGTADGYVGAMKGVIATLAPGVTIDDVAHDLEPGDVDAAAWALRGYWRIFPEGTTHVIVVDPGVGGGRRALAAALDGRFVVAPDNGVATLALDAATEVHLVELTNQEFLRDEHAPTFHGRDVFAPAAAALASGVPLDRLGSSIDNPVRLVWPEPRRARGGIDGVVVHVDRFGSLITNIPRDWTDAGSLVLVGDRLIGPLRRTYSDVALGDLVGLIGSGGTVEVAVRDGNAAAELDAGRGVAVRVEEGEQGIA